MPLVLALITTIHKGFAIFKILIPAMCKRYLISAKDDAAGQAIANRMTAQITGLSQAQRNANDGISISQTAEGALNQVNDNLQRVRELTVQAQNGTNSQDEITRISEETDFNGTKVLASDQGISIQVGANDNEAISVNLQQIDQTTLGLGSFDVRVDQSAQPSLGDQVGYNDTYGEIYEVKDTDGSTVANTFAAKADDGSLIAIKELATADATAANGGYQAVTYEDSAGGGVRNATLQYTATDAANNDYSRNTLIIAGELDGGGTVDTGVTLASATVAANGSETAINGFAEGGLAQLDTALSTVDSLRSELGAVQNRFESAITNLSAARSRIEDADYATEVANMTKAQILQNVLSLLG